MGKQQGGQGGQVGQGRRARGEILSDPVTPRCVLHHRALHHCTHFTDHLELESLSCSAPPPPAPALLLLLLLLLQLLLLLPHHQQQQATTAVGNCSCPHWVNHPRDPFHPKTWSFHAFESTLVYIFNWRVAPRNGFLLAYLHSIYFTFQHCYEKIEIMWGSF